MTPELVAEKLMPVLQHHLEIADDTQPIPLDKSLEELGLNSFGVILLLLELEETFNVAFPDSLLTPEIFRTPATLRDAIVSLVNGQDPG